MTLTAKDFIVICLIGMVFAYLVSDFVTATQRENSIGACNRGSADRAADLFLADSLIVVNERRVEAASSKDEAAANRFAIRRYTKARQKKIDAQASVAVEPGSVKADCDIAYPDPLPVGPFS